MDAGSPIILLVEVKVLYGAFDHSQLVVVVKNDEFIIKGELVGLSAEDPRADAVKGAHPDALGLFFEQFFQAALHLAGGFVGKGHRQDMIRPDGQIVDQVGDAVRTRVLPEPGPARTRLGPGPAVTAIFCWELRILRISTGGILP
jgi:hypothetical protein